MRLSKKQINELLAKFGIEANDVYFLYHAIDSLPEGEQIGYFSPINIDGVVREPSIRDRFDEMRINDQETGEHPDATNKDYREWATEEYWANHHDYLCYDPRYNTLNR